MPGLIILQYRDLFIYRQACHLLGTPILRYHRNIGATHLEKRQGSLPKARLPFCVSSLDEIFLVLQSIEGSIESPLGHQGFMGSFFYNPPF